jgi:phosphoserine phosphatase RsbX
MLDWGVASLTCPGETESGDAYVVDQSGRSAFVAVIDALGHGYAAAQVARLATKTLRRHREEELDSLLQQCHTRLRGTRGATISVASFDRDRGKMTWLGVGSVAGVLSFASFVGVPHLSPLLVRSGVVGDRLPELRPATFDIRSGDMLVLATDGVRTDFAEDLSPLFDPQPLADRILRLHATGNDDALVLVGRYKGGSG